jgi:MOSC domain-containing protein YiiM
VHHAGGIRQREITLILNNNVETPWSGVSTELRTGGVGMRNARVVSIQIAAKRGEPLHEVKEVRAVEGTGLEGDRHFGRGDGPGYTRDITLVEVETLEAIERELGIKMHYGDSRRNIVTSGIALNHMIGREFRVGDVLLRGQKLCEPCNYLRGKIGKRVGYALVHRAGLRAYIVKGGTIRIGDEIHECSPALVFAGTGDCEE